MSRLASSRRRAALEALTSPQAVREAVREFDTLGRTAFLAKYGFGKAQRYFLEIDGRHYDSKAIVGVAYGYQFPERGPLGHPEFSGGEKTVQAKLEHLGFVVQVLALARLPRVIAD